jgi:hypothetical protein
MNPITDFRNRLQQINIEALHSPIPNLSEEMAQTTQRLRTEYGDISRGAGDQHGIAAAVIDYLKTRQLPTYRDIKYVCFGVSSPYGNPLTRVIEHETLFPKLLKEVGQLQLEPRKFRRCYQGLLKAYLHYPGQHTEQAIGHKNWLTLREFLGQHCKTLKQQKPVLEWTQALYEHRNLLADNPCQPYAKAMLAGDRSVVDELKIRLGIDDDTWVMNELVLAQVQAATALKDAEFVLQVTPLVLLLEQHSGLITKGLALLLRRYEACKEHTEHPALREAALKQWKSPWLDANKPIWHGYIGESATNMIRLWLTKQHIKDFFGLLQADGQADRQRMEFWLQYAEAIDDFWLALGTYSFTNRQADYQRIRTQMEGRCMRLEGSNHSRENAFLMKIGNYIFIEFGNQNHACHIFRADNKPFTTGQTSVSGTTAGLKNINHPGHFTKLTHRHDWQNEFADFLRSYANAMPVESKPKTAASSISFRALDTPKTTASHETVNIVSPSNHSISAQTRQIKIADISQLSAFCAAHKLRIDDNRADGGAFWVRAPNNDKVITDVLKSLRFKYKEGKGWWRE